MHLRLILILTVLTGRLVASPIDHAISLWKQQRFSEAQAVLQPLVIAEPGNAQAHYYLGLSRAQRRDEKAFDEALPSLEKAATLAPGNAEILTGYGEVCMAFAQRHTSLSMAKRGREALETALKIDPESLKAREILYQYYARAPWPIGSSAKAEAQLAEIRKRSPNRAMTLAFNAKIVAKQFSEVFKACDELLMVNPADAVALFYYGRTSAISGENGERGIEYLEKYIALAPTVSDSPPVANAWARIGQIEEKRGRLSAAREAYEKALQLEPNNRTATQALVNLQKLTATMGHVGNAD